MQQKLQTLKGFRDLLPDEKRKRNYVTKKIIEIFELFGFEPFETPTLEYASLLLGKYGKEADRLVYTFEDKGKRKIGLIYDQTVPISRVLAQYQNELPKYFRRYQMQNVFRAEKPQKGRYREFTQCDIDIFGSSSLVADAEIIACSYFAFKNVGFKEIIISINDRQILFNTLSEFSTDDVNVFSIIQSVDKLDKVDGETVVKELIGKGLEKKSAENALNAIKKAKVSENLKKTIAIVKQLGVPEGSLKYEPFLARGLDYYTGTIFEIKIPQFTIGSFGGGGRYDKLIKNLGGPDVPATGISFGFDRIVQAASELDLIPKDNMKPELLITIFDKNSAKSSYAVVLKFRKAGIKTELFPSDEINIKKQFKYADKKGFRWAVIIGPVEIEKKIVQLKNLETKEQVELSVENAIKKIRN